MNLYPFQEKAVYKLKDQRGILLAHDMGLGKTVTAISLDLEKRKRFDYPPKTLVICPLSVISTWREHYNRWAPHLRVMTVDHRRRGPFMECVDNSFKEPGFGFDVFIIHYAAVRIEKDLARYPWFHVICDEVHALQDKDSAQSKAIKKLKAFYKSGLSGTPVFNKPDDLWSILNWLYPKYWTSYWSYYKRYLKWVEWDGYRTVVGIDNEEELQKQISGFYDSIKKEEVMIDLPEKYYSTIKVGLHPKQERAYKQMKRDMLAWIGEHEDEPVSSPIVLAQLTRLQQFASAYGEVQQRTVYRRKCEEYECLTKNEDCKEDNCLIDSGCLGHNTKRENCEEKDCLAAGECLGHVECKGHIEDYVVLTEPSTKIDAVMDKIKSTEEPIVVFSQFSQMVELLAKRLEKEKISCGLYTGSVPKADRDQVVRDFQDGKLRVFAGSIKAGGMGITLTRASTVIILNEEWAETLNKQAIDRLHRIGQKNAVHVIYITAENTIDSERNLSILNNWQIIKKLLDD